MAAKTWPTKFVPISEIRVEQLHRYRLSQSPNPRLILFALLDSFASAVLNPRPLSVASVRFCSIPEFRLAPISGSKSVFLLG
jgi:hypothetical protein